MTTLYAWTSPAETYPPFVNITRKDDGTATVTVRGSHIVRELNGAQVPDAGATVEVTLPAAEVERLCLALAIDGQNKTTNQRD